VVSLRIDLFVLGKAHLVGKGSAHYLVWRTCTVNLMQGYMYRDDWCIESHNTVDI